MDGRLVVPWLRNNLSVLCSASIRKMLEGGEVCASFLSYFSRRVSAVVSQPLGDTILGGRLHWKCGAAKLAGAHAAYNARRVWGGLHVLVVYGRPYLFTNRV